MTPRPGSESNTAAASRRPVSSSGSGDCSHEPRAHPPLRRRRGVDQEAMRGLEPSGSRRTLRRAEESSHVGRGSVAPVREDRVESAGAELC